MKRSGHCTQPVPKTLLDQVRDAIRLKHYTHSTEWAYVQWIKRFILFHDKRHPEEMGRVEVEAFLTHLAVEENVAASTQNQAFSAILQTLPHLVVYLHPSKRSLP